MECISSEADSFLGGDVGLAITQSMAMTGMVQFGMRQSAEVASQLLSVERVLEYADLPTEDKAGASGTSQREKTKLPN